MSVQAAEAGPIHVSRNAPLRMSADRRGEAGYETMPKAERPPQLLANLLKYQQDFQECGRLRNPDGSYW